MPNGLRRRTAYGIRSGNPSRTTIRGSQLLKKLGEYFPPTDQHVKDLELNFTPTKQHDFGIFS